MSASSSVWTKQSLLVGQTVNTPDFKKGTTRPTSLMDPLELSQLCLRLPVPSACVWLSLFLSNPPVTDFLLVSAPQALTPPPLTSVSICLLHLLAQASVPHALLVSAVSQAHSKFPSSSNRLRTPSAAVVTSVLLPSSPAVHVAGGLSVLQNGINESSGPRVEGGSLYRTDPKLGQTPST